MHLFISFRIIRIYSIKRPGNRETICSSLLMALVPSSLDGKQTFQWKLSPKLPWVRITEAIRMLLPVRYAAVTDLLIFQVGAFQQVLILGRLQCVDVQKCLCMLVGWVSRPKCEQLHSCISASAAKACLKKHILAKWISVAWLSQSKDRSLSISSSFSWAL